MVSTFGKAMPLEFTACPGRACHDRTKSDPSLMFLVAAEPVPVRRALQNRAATSSALIPSPWSPPLVLFLRGRTPAIEAGIEAPSSSLALLP